MATPKQHHRLTQQLKERVAAMARRAEESADGMHVTLKEVQRPRAEGMRLAPSLIYLHPAHALVEFYFLHFQY